jgi:hypothetical protein
MSGEAWQNVQLVLSTASPAVNAAGPSLTPLRVAVAAPTPGGQAEIPSSAATDPFGAPAAGETSSLLLSSDAAQAYAEVLPSLFQQQRDAEAGGESGQTHAAEDRDGELNRLSEKVQQIELQIDPSTWRALAPDAGDEVASQVYSLPQLVSLDTRRELQLVQVLETQLTGEMYHVATPLLSTYAYREARIKNSQAAGLLSGPTTIYLDDTFVGRTQLPSTASGQTLTIGFGADQQVRTRRELMSKQDEIKGGNRRLTFSYRLVLNNFKSEPIALRLLDRMPLTLAPGQLTVQLNTPQVPLSADELYQRMQRPTGILRWDLDVPAHRHSGQAFDLHYRYELEFDRNRMPTTQHLLADILAEFEGQAMPAMGGMGGGFGGGGIGGGGFFMPGTGK